ncbi:hypothetical protein STIAU_1806 [Stigmatella aurantiaca DW4/3-1]|uniref:Uncharacterized protein n=2 Tax=Stigmatella aurantiaca (strain DW4/3-1) TaxID=378806 RepID=Q08ZL4_STIAD|nr:hypothetical protein STIAU_1806 [Stigmatella aurantiaca DW4/3-1]
MNEQRPSLVAFGLSHIRPEVPMFVVLLGTLVLAATPALPAATCLFANGETACGYACKTSSTQVRCASTPYGTCAVFNGEVHCLDPLPASIHHPPDEGLRPECKEVRGTVACGFRCLVTKGKVACAQTPYGVCREHFGEVKCWDPTEASIHEFGAEIPRPTCATAGTGIACGYDCKTSRTEVACAQTPRGRCTQEEFRLGCFDPPSLLQCAHSQPPPPDEVRKPKSQRRKDETAKAE